MARLGAGDAFRKNRREVLDDKDLRKRIQNTEAQALRTPQAPIDATGASTSFDGTSGEVFNRIGRRVRSVVDATAEATGAFPVARREKARIAANDAYVEPERPPRAPVPIDLAPEAPSPPTTGEFEGAPNNDIEGTGPGTSVFPTPLTAAEGVSPTALRQEQEEASRLPSNSGTAAQNEALEAAKTRNDGLVPAVPVQVSQRTKGPQRIGGYDVQYAPGTSSEVREAFSRTPVHGGTRARSGLGGGQVVSPYGPGGVNGPSISSISGARPYSPYGPDGKLIPGGPSGPYGPGRKEREDLRQNEIDLAKQADLNAQNQALNASTANEQALTGEHYSRSDDAADERNVNEKARTNLLSKTAEGRLQLERENTASLSAFRSTQGDILKQEEERNQETYDAGSAGRQRQSEIDRALLRGDTEAVKKLRGSQVKPMSEYEQKKLSQGDHANYIKFTQGLAPGMTEAEKIKRFKAYNEYSKQGLRRKPLPPGTLPTGATPYTQTKKQQIDSLY